MFLRGYDYSFQLRNVQEWLRLSIVEGPPEMHDNTVVIDQFDMVLDHYGLADTMQADVLKSK